MNTTKLLLYVVGLLILIIIGGGVMWSISANNHRQQMINANNDLAALFPLKHINDSLAVRVTQVKTDLNKEMSKTSQLRKIIDQRDEKILSLIHASMVARTDTVEIRVRERVGTECFFDSTNQWFTIAGWYDTTKISLQAIEMRDSITIAIAQARNAILYGYIQNHSPYNRIVNAQFSIDAGQYMPEQHWLKKISPYVRVLALGSSVFDTKRKDLWAGLAFGFSIFDIVF